MSELDFDDSDCWQEPRTYASAEVGDVFDGAPLSRLDDSFELIALDESGRQFAVPAIFTLAIVVGLYEDRVVFAPITTARDVSDSEAFRVLVESSRTAEKWARLPALRSAWAEDAVAVLFQPSTLPLLFLDREPPQRIAAMTPSAQALLRRRFSRAWES